MTIQRIFISALGQHSSLGQGLKALQEGLQNLRQPNIENLIEDTQKGPRTLKVYVAPEVETPACVSENVARRMARVSKMFLAAAAEAMDEAFLNKEKNPSRLGLVVGTGFSTLQPATVFQKSLHTNGSSAASPTLFAGSVQNSIAAQLSMTFGIQGPTSTVMTMEQTTINSFRLAYDWLQEDLVDHVLIVLGDEICGYNSYALAHHTLSEKLDPQSDACTMMLGEGAVAFVLSKENKYCEVSDIQIYTEKAPPVERHFVASFGGEGQRSRHEKFIGAKANLYQHASLYGGLVVGLAFEIAIAALQVQKDGLATSCIQVTDHDEAQSLILSAKSPLSP